MNYPAIILAAAKSAGISGALLLAICTHESNLTNVMVPNDNGDPSYGICQIKEGTAKDLGFTGKSSGPLKIIKHGQFKGDMEPMGNGIGLMNPSVNASYAALYLKKQLERYDGDLCKSVASYNSGTYLPSKKSPGKPRNLKYVKKVVLLLDAEHKDMLVCGPRSLK